MNKPNSLYVKELEKRFGKAVAKEILNSKCPIHKIEYSLCPECQQAICKECLE